MLVLCATFLPSLAFAQSAAPTSVGSTASSTASLIQSLYAELQSLEAQIAALGATNTSSTPQTTSTTCAPLQLTQNLSLGSTGNDVTALQQFLVAQGYLEVAPTGYFGTLTQAAVQAFQSAEGIVSSGTPQTTGYGQVGPQTRAKISSLTATCQNGTTASQATPALSATVATSTQSAATSSVTSIPLSTPIVSLSYGGGGEGGGGSNAPAPTPDTTAPSISFTAPAASSTVSGTSVTLTASASDNVAVANVQFEVNSTDIGSAITSSPYMTTWDSTGVSDGTYTLSAVAEDTSGNYATSSESITVSNGIIYTNFQGPYKNGSYSSYAGLWELYNDPTLGLGHTAVEGVDYVSSTKVFPNTFPDGTQFIWSVPNPGYGGVYGYLHSDYGNYDDTDPQTPITPLQVYEITDLTSTFDYDLDVTSGSADLLHELWLTSTSHQTGGVSGAAEFEVGVLPNLSTSTDSYFDSQTLIGTYHDGIDWEVREDPTANGGAAPFIMFAPADRTDFEGTFHWADAFAFLIDNGIITGNEWFNGLAFGVEPTAGAGTLTLTDYNVSYAGAARVPWTVSDLVATAESTSTVLLSYTAPAGATSQQYSINGGAWMSLSTTTISGLTAATEYTFEVRGVNSTGDGAASNIADVTTQASSHDLDFIVNDYKWNGSEYSTLSALFAAAGEGSFARSTGGYDLAATTWFSANTPRITSVGLLIEPAATNYVLYSQNLEMSEWVLDSGATVSADATTAPDGTATADDLTTTNYYQKIVQAALGLTNGATYTVSVFGKNVSGTTPLLLDLQGPSNGGQSVTLNSSTWTRGSYTNTSSGTSANMFIFNGGAPGTNAYWGAQVEAGATSTSYIPTTGTTATRGADVLVLPVPLGKTGALITFSDNSTQTVTGLTGGGTWTVPTNLNEPIIKYIDWQ